MSVTIGEDIVTQCYDALMAQLQSIAVLRGKLFVVYSLENLLDNLKGVPQPGAGVVYEGMRSVSQGGPPGLPKVGVATEAVFSVLLVVANDSTLGVATYSDGTIARDQALKILADTRAAIRGRKSPSGHFWQFLMEAPAAEKKGVVLWVQRWSTPVVNL